MAVLPLQGICLCVWFSPPATIYLHSAVSSVRAEADLSYSQGSPHQLPQRIFLFLFFFIPYCLYPRCFCPSPWHLVFLSHFFSLSSNFSPRVSQGLVLKRVWISGNLWEKPQEWNCVERSVRRRIFRITCNFPNSEQAMKAEGQRDTATSWVSLYLLKFSRLSGEIDPFRLRTATKTQGNVFQRRLWSCH